MTNTQLIARQRVLTLDEVQDIVDLVRFQDWVYEVSKIDGRDGFYLQISANEINNKTGDPMRWKSRKWLLSVYSTNSEIVQTCFKATMAAMEHEMREQFTYKGAAIFGPHHDVDDLAARFPAQDLRVSMTPRGQI